MLCPSRRIPRVLPTASFVLVLGFLTIGANAQNSPQPVRESTIRKAPYRSIGRLEFDNSGQGVGSGTVIDKDVVLTCAHVMYDPSTGFSSKFTFERGKYGSIVLQRAKPTSATVMSGYRGDSRDFGSNSPTAFANDLAIIRFKDHFTGGAMEYRSRASLLTNRNSLKEAFGYGTDASSGNRLLSAKTHQGCDKVKTGYYFNFGILLEPGMSGGPLVTRTNAGLRLCAVNVSGRDPDPANNVKGVSGYRAIDGKASKFIKQQIHRNPK